MTPLRQRMLEDMQLRNFSPQTQRSYIHYVAQFANFYDLSPARLGLEDIRQYQLYLTEERKLSPQSVNCFVSAAKFLYTVTLEMPWTSEHFTRPKMPERLPVILSPSEVKEFFAHIGLLKHRVILMVCYGAGLRISEAVSLRVADIDSQRMVLRVQQGKGGRDRETVLSPRLLWLLRYYYRCYRPKEWLFPTSRPGCHIDPETVRQVCRDACRLAGWTKQVTPHTLRHSFASHLLDDGADIRVLQALLGHKRIDTTAHYTAVSHQKIASTVSPLDKLAGAASAKGKGQTKAKAKLNSTHNA
jgi:site-specific recombinase XerD